MAFAHSSLRWLGISDLIAELAVAMEFGASAEDIARSVHAHPTLAEAVKAQCEIFEDDAAEVAAKKADAAVRELFGDEEVAPQIRALVG